MRRLLALIAVSLTVLVTPAAPGFAGDPVVNFETDDRQMNAAIRKARRSLPRFYKKATAAELKTGAFSVKVALPYGSDGGHEHIWDELRKRNGKQMEGVLQNNPVYVPHRLGQKVQFHESNISDWSYWEGGKIHGSYTTRVILPRLPAAEAAKLKAMLAPLPKG